MPQQPASSSTTSAPGMRSSSCDGRRACPRAPSGGSGRGTGCAARPVVAQRQVGVEQQLLDELRAPRDAAVAEQLHVLLAQRQQAARLAAGDRALGLRQPRRVSASAFARASSSRPLEIDARPQQPAVLEPHVVAGGLSSSIEARPTPGSVNVVNESARKITGVPASLARSRSQRISVSRSNRGRGRLAA